jgi:hypothetical protein
VTDQELDSAYFCVVSEIGISMVREACAILYAESQQKAHQEYLASSPRSMRILLAAATGLRIINETPYPGVRGYVLRRELSNKFRGQLSKRQMQNVMTIIQESLEPIAANASEIAEREEAKVRKHRK